MFGLMNRFAGLLMTGVLMFPFSPLKPQKRLVTKIMMIMLHHCVSKFTGYFELHHLI